MTTTTGRCLCGAVTYTFDASATIWTGHCHCESCRRACAAPMVSWFGVPNEAWRWTAAQPAHYKSSTWADRYFCATCGSQMAYRSDKLPNVIHGLSTAA